MTDHDWMTVFLVIVLAVQIWQLHKRVDAVFEEVKKLTQPKAWNDDSDF